MPNLRIRRARDEDRGFLEDACIRAGQPMMTAARGQWDEERERQQFRRQLDIGSTSIVECDGRDVAFLMVLVREGMAEIHSLYVLPEWQGRGIGTKVTREVVDVALRDGRPVELSVLKVNPRARALYERLGFRVVSETESHERLRFAP